MATHSRTWIMFLAFLFIVVPVAADTQRATIVTEIEEEGKKVTGTEIITIDGANKARIDVLGEEKKPSDKTPYLLTVDGGNTWLIGNKQKAYCAQMDTTKFFQYLGGLARKFGSIASLEIQDPKVTKVLEEKSPKLLGFPTRHVRLVTTARGKAVLVKSYDYKIHVTDDIWYTTQMDLHPVRKRWLEAMSQSGFKQLDTLIDQRVANLAGPILKQDSVIKVTNVVNNKDDLITKKTRVVNFEKLKLSDIPEQTFHMPSCNKISKKEMRDMAKDLFERGKML